MDYRKEARSGEAMLRLAENEDFQIFKTEILGTIKEEAIQILTETPANDHIAIIGGQQRNKVVERIEVLMLDLVERGRLALSELRDSNPDDEDGGLA